MQLQPSKFATAAALTAALLFIVCWLIVAAFPDTAATATGHMLHSDMSQLEWDMAPTGVILGALYWAAGTGAAAWFAAVTYNRLLGTR